MNKIYWFIAVIITCSYLNSGAQADELVVREFEKHQLSSVYWSEGVPVTATSIKMATWM